VAASVQRLAQGAEGGGVTVAPGRSDGEAENNDLHKQFPVSSF
jgi:hypothetical protein